MFKLAKFVFIGLAVSAAAQAHDDWHGHHHYHHHSHYYPVEQVYVPAPVVEYVPVQPVYYAPPPAPVYYQSYDQRSPQGLVGGMLGSALGYQMGGGDPIASGFGAAAGAWFGNGMGR